jgi:hypothetical protein
MGHILLGEVGFHESCTPALKDKVVPIESDPYSTLPLLTIPSTVTQIRYTDLDLIDEACYRLLQVTDRKGSSKLVLGLDIEYDVEPDGQGGMLARPGLSIVDTVQLASPGAVYVFKVRHFLYYETISSLW